MFILEGKACISGPSLAGVAATMMKTVPLANQWVTFKTFTAPCEDRTHDLQIMRLTRYLLR